MKYLKHPGAVLAPFDGSGSGQRYLCEVPRPDGGMRRFAVASEVAHLASLFDGDRDLPAILEEHKRAHPQSEYTVEKLARLVKEFCIPQSLVIDPAAAGSDPSGAQPIPSSRYMYAKVKLLSHDLVYPVARKLAWLYWRPVFIFFITLSILMHGWFYLHLLRISRFDITKLDGAQLLAVTLLTIGAAFCHEFGHATALAAHGCRRLQIGFGIYLYFPVLYTDVSEAWRLQRLQRVLVDLGGIYFHCLSQLALLAAYYIWHREVLLYAIFMIDITITSSLNPFLRMDGYWMLSDFCGLWNLRKQSFGLVRHVFRRLAGRTSPGAFDLEPKTVRILMIYTAVFICFVGYVAYNMAYQLFAYMIPEYPGLWAGLLHDLIHPQSVGLAHVLGKLFEVFWKSIVLFGCCWFAINGLRRALVWVSSQIKRRRARTQLAEGCSS